MANVTAFGFSTSTGAASLSRSASIAATGTARSRVQSSTLIPAGVLMLTVRGTSRSFAVGNLRIASGIASSFARAKNTYFPSGPVVDQNTGELNAVWRAFFLALWTRTGGATGK